MKLSESTFNVKAILLGISGMGKSGSTVPLSIPDFYPGFPGLRLRVIDMDSKYPEIALSILNNLLETKRISPDQHAAALDNIDVVTCPEPMGIVDLPGTKQIQSGFSISGGSSKKQIIGVAGKTEAYLKAMNQLKAWDSSFTSDHVLILDSLTYMAQAIVNFALELMGKLNQGIKWQDYPDPQSKLMAVLQYFAEKPCHSLILAHQTTHEVYKKTGRMASDGSEEEELISSNVVPVSIGKAKSVEVPARFNHLLAYVTDGVGKSVERYIYTKPHSGIVTKSPFMSAADRYQLADGLVKYFMLAPGVKKSPQ
jgi:hypothetical protein